MEKNNTRRHCPEVENLMDGKMPFVTRHGITIVGLILVAVVGGMLLSEGTPQLLMKDIVEYTMEQIVSKL